jgi:hypothetical protein
MQSSTDEGNFSLKPNKLVDFSPREFWWDKSFILKSFQKAQDKNFKSSFWNFNLKFLFK